MRPEYAPSAVYSRDGAKGAALAELPVPPEYDWLPPNALGYSVAELVNLYAAHARDSASGSRLAPTFADAVRMHQLMDQIVESDRAGKRVDLIFTV